MVPLPDIGLGNSNLMKATLPEFIEIAARHGFRTITVRPYAFLEALRDGHSERGLRRRLADAGITVSMIDGLNNGLPGVPDPDSLAPAIRAVMPPDVLRPAALPACLRAANALGAGMLNVIAYRAAPVPIEEMSGALDRIAARAAAAGVRLALEFLPDSGVPDIDHARRLIAACAGGCGITLDVFHLDRSGGTVDDVRRLAPGAVACIQISDRDAGGAENGPLGGRMMPGDGNLPLRELVAAALENNPAARVDIEVLNATLSGASPDAAARMLSAAVSGWRETFRDGRPGALREAGASG